MRNFNYNIPTKVYFGKGQLSALADEILRYKNILIVYGQGSVVHSGLLQRVVDIIQESGKKHVELSGVEPNPRVSLVRKGIALCREHHIDLVLALGGGSVIDTSKGIAMGVYQEADPWEVIVEQKEISQTVPVATILTLAATGSEMNPYAVISNEATEEKLGVGSPLLYPVFSILDPELTYSVSRHQTACGAVDIMSHVLEQYFCPVADTFIQNRLSEAIMETVVEFAPIALEEPDNYHARAELMWAGSLALNGLLSYGKIGDWSVHGMEHELSAIYNITHADGLAILQPAWMKYVLSEETVDRFAEYAERVWKIPTQEDKMAMAEAGIQKTRDFFNALGMPDRLSQVNINASSFEQMAEKAVSLYRNGQMGMLKKLGKEDVVKIFQSIE